MTADAVTLHLEQLQADAEMHDSGRKEVFNRPHSIWWQSPSALPWEQSDQQRSPGVIEEGHWHVTIRIAGPDHSASGRIQHFAATVPVCRLLLSFLASRDAVSAVPRTNPITPPPIEPTDCRITFMMVPGMSPTR